MRCGRKSDIDRVIAQTTAGRAAGKVRCEQRSDSDPYSLRSGCRASTRAGTGRSRSRSRGPVVLEGRNGGGEGELVNEVELRPFCGTVRVGDQSVPRRGRYPTLFRHVRSQKDSVPRRVDFREFSGTARSPKETVPENLVFRTFPAQTGHGTRPCRKAVALEPATGSNHPLHCRRCGSQQRPTTPFTAAVTAPKSTHPTPSTRAAAVVVRPRRRANMLFRCEVRADWHVCPIPSTIRPTPCTALIAHRSAAAV